jgi:hypothetical protein
MTARDGIHHLDRKRNRWRLRVTVSRGEKVVGKRLVIHTGTTDYDEALIRRELIAEAYRALGLTIIDRRIARPKSSA